MNYKTVFSVDGFFKSDHKSLPEYPVFYPWDQSTKKKAYLSCYPGYSCFLKKKTCFPHIYTGTKPEN